MRGHLRKRSPGSWTLVFDTYVLDSATGKPKRKVKSVTVRGTKREAEQKLAELLHKSAHGDFIEPSRVTFGDWLDAYLRTLEPPARAERTHREYRSTINRHIRPALGLIRLQQLTVTDLETFYHAQAKTLSPATVGLQHAIISGALRSAVRKQYLTRNVAQLVDNLPRRPPVNRAAMDKCFDEHEAPKFLKAALAHSPQVAAFFSLALNSGMRLGELCGLQWQHTDLDKGKVTICQQLTRVNPPQLDRLKRGTARTIDIDAGTVTALRRHRKAQAEERLKNGKYWHDNGLVFARGWAEARTAKSLGAPLQKNLLGANWLKPLCETAGVRCIGFHGLRHTVATLLLKAGESPHVVAHRIGHASVTLTLNIYAHALPSQQQDAAEKLARLMRG